MLPYNMVPSFVNACTAQTGVPVVGVSCAKGLMKDRFHYLQPAYNAVGTEAGRNAAAYWNR